MRADINQESLAARIITCLCDKRFALKGSVEITVSKEKDGYIVSNEQLNVHAVGETREEARRDWEQVLIDLYLSYRDVPDDQLTEGARSLKEQLMATVEDISDDTAA